MPAPIFRTFDPADTIITFKAFQLFGFQDGVHIATTRNQDSYAIRPGALGDVTRIRMRDRTGRVTVTVMKESPVNDLLSAIHVADELNNSGVGTLAIQSLNTTTILEAPNAWIVRLPDFENATEASGVEWLFDCDVLAGVHGGANS